MVRALLGLLVLVLVAGPALGQDASLRERALDDAFAMFEAALPSLGPVEFGVDVTAYRAALGLQRFTSDRWGGTVTVDVQMAGGSGERCGDFAAFVRVPPAQSVVPLVLCPKFFTEGADHLRRLTILHEIVHVVAGTDECQAMAFAARIEQAASGRFTPVETYWRQNGCGGSGYRLPE